MAGGAEQECGQEGQEPLSAAQPPRAQPPRRRQGQEGHARPVVGGAAGFPALLGALRGQEAEGACHSQMLRTLPAVRKPHGRKNV